MNQNYRRDKMEHTGYLGNSRLVLNHFDVSTQADIHHMALSYESEDEIMARIHQNKGKRGAAAHYSKQDIREQYCISERGLGVLESDRQSLFGCLSSHQNSPCTNRASFLTACVRQKAPSDENLYELYKRHPAEYAPYPRRSRYPWSPVAPEMYRYDEDLKTSYFRRKPHVDPSRYTWMPSDDESVRMEKPKSIMEPFHSNQIVPPPPPSKKHVSFARSYTLTSFDDAIVSLDSSSSHLNKITRSQERLLDVRKTELQPITRQPEPSENILVIDKMKRAPMKTQATQTEACLGRKPLPPRAINLSPRTIRRVKMVSQGAQTNGLILNGRKLIKSYSEAGNRFIGILPDDFPPSEPIADHDPLQRTQSDEPPRSPFIVTTPPPYLPLPNVSPAVPSDSSSMSRSDHESEDSESKKEIFIDFKPQIPPKLAKRPLTKAVSDGQMLLEMLQKDDDVVVPEKQLTSISHECILSDDQPRAFTPYFQKSPIRYEGVCKQLAESIFSSVSESFDETGFRTQDSLDEEFHENLICNPLYLGRQESFDRVQDGICIRVSESRSPNDEGVVPTICLLPDRRLSPFNSNDSLANDFRDHSDGIWNESQATVLQADSGTDNGTAVSSSEMASIVSPGSVNLLTPSSRRKHLLMLQHQQRSSMDTEALEEEYVEQVQTEASPRIVINKPPKTIQHVPKQIYLTTPRAVSPSWRSNRPLPESPTESPQPAVVPDLVLARIDSCKTNTDISESTTTDDYITANSGTDSSRKSGSIKGKEIYSTVHTQLYDGSSFESNKGDYLGDDMVVPSFSPVIVEENRSLSNTPVPEARTGRSTPSDTSSSCGSYSVDGSCPDLLDRTTSTTTTTTVPSAAKAYGSEDERSVHYSSSGYYESPPDDEVTWKSTSHENNSESSHHHKRRPYILEIAKHQDVHNLIPCCKRESAASSPKDRSKTSEKPKRISKSRTRSPMQNHKKLQHLKKSHSKNELKSDDRFKTGAEESKMTSDDSSCDFALGAKKFVAIQTSPRKSKKNKDNNRRKSLPRSPTNHKEPRRDSDEKPSSLPGSLSRRRSVKHNRGLQPEDANKLLPAYSPTGSPNAKKQSPQQKTPETTKLKALSAESLRSVSPGSDSVFYSDPSSHTATDHHVHCLHCGKEVDIITTTNVDKSGNGAGGQHDIVQPPAGFEDSPKIKQPTTSRLYKKLERRLHSEERAQAEQRRHRYRPDVRAKSEERGAKTYRKLRPMARSTTNSQEGLKATDSSPCVLPGAPDDEDDLGIYDVPYTEGCWIYIDERDEVLTGSKTSSPTDQCRRSSVSSTESEEEFRKRYQAVTHRMVHRKSCLEMYKRQTSRSFGEYSTKLIQYLL